MPRTTCFRIRPVLDQDGLPISPNDRVIFDGEVYKVTSVTRFDSYNELSENNVVTIIPEKSDNHQIDVDPSELRHSSYLSQSTHCGQLKKLYLWGYGGMADAGDLKSLAERREGSNPSTPTFIF